MNDNHIKSEKDVLQTHNASIAEKVLKKMLVGTFLTDIYYSAGFRIEFSREGKTPAPLIPMVVRITLRSKWSLGNIETWETLLAQNPRKDLTGDSEEPMRAFALMCLNGTQIVDVKVDRDGTLHLMASCGQDLHIPGQEDVFEESWIADVPSDVPNAELWSALCTDKGDLFCRYPAAEI